MKIEKIILAAGEKKPEHCGLCELGAIVNNDNVCIYCVPLGQYATKIGIHPDCPIEETKIKPYETEEGNV